ncbi:hypothetical protein N9E03_01150 [bacterium]|nr:hypothetical protein [bacterium]
MDQNYILNNLRANTSRDSALETLMDFERVMDNANIYAYKNWMEGEIVEGPHIDRYWVTVTLMYHKNLMPDPEGAMRLTRNGCKVYFAEEEYITAAKLKSPDDSEGQDGADGRRPGQTRAKRVIKPIWLVTVVMPRKYMNDVEAAKLRVDDQGIDSNAVEQAYTDEISAADEGLDL